MDAEIQVLKRSIDRTPSRCAALRALIRSPDLEFIMEAHNGLSARIVAEAGFKGIWASGLALSAQFGVRDNNEASWTQVVDMLEFMGDAVDIPILLDGDTGYGNFNNMRRLVRKLEQRGIAGVCIEDKVFPKTNSFIDGEHQPLADPDEFCGKIKAAKDTQEDDDFCVVARTEALIAGWGMDEALRRAEAYHRAGADAILIHSKQSRATQVVQFARAWGGRCPLVIVPTKYYSTPTEVFRTAGISLVIWANHMIRSAISAMAQTARQVHQEQTLASIEDRIAPVSEIFRLQGADELAAAERRYLRGRQRVGAVVLAATRGAGLEDMTRDRPKVMLPVAGVPLLHRLMGDLKSQGVNDLTVVAGYRPEAIDAPGVRVVENPDHEHSGELASLACARDALVGDTIVTYGDLLFRRHVLRDLLDNPGDLVAVVDSAPSASPTELARDAADCSQPDDLGLFEQRVNLLRIRERRAPATDPPHGRWIGLLLVRETARRAFLDALDTLATREDFDSLGMPDLLNDLIEAGQRIDVHYIHGHWLDVNTMEDLGRAHGFASGQPR